MIRGSCLCGTVRWEADPPVDRMTHCHCSMCRKAHGAAFATYALVPTEQVRLTAGADALRYRESSTGMRRSFCSICGSVGPLQETHALSALPAGCLDEDPGVRPDAHIYFASRAPWHAVGDDGLPRFDASSRGGTDAVTGRPVPGAAGKVVHGSCLCGGIAFEVHGPFRAVHNCHCSRCRKARAAAHTTNGFTPIDAVHFTRGEDLLELYELPGARFFAQAFCRDCGSGMPRLDPGRGIAVIPLGALDDDPGRGAQDHIFAADAAPWHTIADELPQHPQGLPG